MRVNRPLRLTAAAALSSIVATVALAGPMAGSALAAAKQRAPLPNVTATLSAANSTPLGSRTASSTAHFSWAVVSGESYTCFLDGGSKTNCTTSADYSGLASGTHTFTIKVGKLTGYRPNTYVYTWMVDRTPPASPPAVDPLPTPTSSITANVTFSKVDLSTASFKCALDDAVAADATACSSPWPLSNLSEQSHTAYVYAVDDLGNMNTTAGKVTWVVDHTAPSSPTVSVTPVGPTSSTDASITWVDGDAVSFSCVLDNNAPVNNCTTPWALHNLTEGTHVVAVTGTDAAGNVGTPGKAHWIVDRTPPPAPIIATGPATSTDSAMATFQFGDADASATFSCKLDSSSATGSYAPCASPTSYLGPLADGNYVFSVRATDAAGNTGPSSSWAWTIDTTNPPASSPPQILTGPAPLTHDVTPTFTFMSLDDPAATFLCAVDPADASNQAAYATCASGDTFNVAVDGAHTLYVEEVSAGVASLPTTWNWTLDSTPPPAPTFSAKPDPFSNATGALFNFSDSEANVSYVCQLDAQTPFACTTPANVTQLAEGTHTFKVTATDAAGNTGAGSVATYAWTVDLTPPAKPTVTGLNPSGIAATLTFTDVDADVTSYRCTLDASLPASCTASPTFTNLAGGVHTVLVQAVDHAGNIGLPQSFSWTVDPGAPNVPSWTSTPAHLINTRTADFAFSDAGNVADPHKVVTSFQCWLDGTKLPQCTSTDLTSVPSGTMHLTGLAEGEHTFTVVGVNWLGNGTPSADYSFTVDVTAPVISVTGLPTTPGQIVPTTSVTTSVTDNDLHRSGIYTCSLTGPNAFSSSDCTGASGLADGTYTFTADTTDNAGNAAQTFTRSWTVDATAPVLHVSGLPAEGASVNWTSFTPSVTQTELHQGPVVCALDGAPVSCSDLGTVTDGPHTFTADTTDTAGNPAVTSVSHFTADRGAPAQPDVQGTHGVVGSTTASFTYGDSSQDVTSYRCSLDGGTEVECPSSFPGLGDGGHSLDVVAKDAAGNTSPVRTVSWTVDTLAPVLHVTGLPSATTPVNWTSFTPSVTQTELHQTPAVCALDGDPVSCSDLGTVSEGTHIFTADATDAAGNAADSVTQQFTVDRTAPVLALADPTSLPQPGSVVNDAAETFTITQTDDHPGTPMSCTLNGAPSSCGSIDTSADGSYAFVANVTDAAGNPADPFTRSWTVDRTAPAPAVSIAGVADGSTVDKTDAYVATIDQSSEQHPGTPVCTLNGGPVDCSGFPAQEDGHYTFTVNVTDAAGNAADPVSISWTVDTSGPGKPWIAGNSVGNGGVTQTRQPALTAADSDAVASYDCVVTGAPAVSCSVAPDGTISFSHSLADGTYGVTVRAYDAVHNPSLVSDAFSFDVDNAKPVLSLDGLPGPGAVVKDAVETPQVTQVDAHKGDITCTLNGQPADCASLSGLTDGDYTFTATTTDTAGNVADPVSRSWTVDQTAPSLDVTGLPAAGSTVNHSSESVSVSQGTEPHQGAVSCTLNGAPSSCSSLTGLTDGAYTFTADTTDAAGNAATQFTRSWIVDATAPTMSFQAPLTLNGNAMVTFSEPVNNLSLSSLKLQVTGGSTVPTTAKCFQLAATVPCGTAGVTTVALHPTRLLVPGQHYTVAAAAGAAQDVATNVSLPVSGSFRAQRALEENVLPVATAWQKARAAVAYGHSYATEHLAGAQASWTFSGRSVTWWTMTGPTEGKAAVYVDGHRKAIVNNYAPETSYRVARTFKRLSAGRHVLTIRVLGVKGNKAGTGTAIGIDAFTVGKKRTSSPRLTVTWHRLSGSGYTSRHALVADLKGEAISLTFRGTSITWTTVRNRTQGKAAVYVDGVRKAVVDNFSTKSLLKVRRVVRGLTDSVHTVRIVVLGTHHKGAKGNNVTVDRFAIG